jgi:hypothetical protein
MDKVTTATAALYGFRADTGLTGDRYSWVGSAFYVSNSNLHHVHSADIASSLVIYFGAYPAAVYFSAFR